MNRTWMGALCALVMMTGCMAEDLGHDGVASQESAVESAPAPDPTEDMQIIRDACEAKCDIGGTVCHNNCRPSDGSWCDANCEGDQDICRGQCGVDFPGFVGTAAPDDSSSDAISDDDPHLPGSCTNPVACGTTGGVDPNGQGGGSGTHPTEYCMGCICTANPTTCDSCVRRCLHRREICLYNGGGSNCGTGGDCNTECDADNLVCVCPARH